MELHCKEDDAGLWITPVTLATETNVNCLDQELESLDVAYRYRRIKPCQKKLSI